METRKRTMWMAVGVAALLLVLGGAAFVGGRLLSARDDSVSVQIGPGELLDGESGVSSQSFKVETQMADGLPEAAPEVTGLLLERNDNSLWIGTGDLQPVITEKDDGTVDFRLSHSGPKIEVVVTGQTQVYKDVTEMNFDSPGSSVQQKVEPGSTDEMGSESMIVVWGNRTGDRVVAQVLLYSLPQVVEVPAG